ncbi:hypothetical protein LY78DRAFT_664634 [Colletotrichum sublineola]|nr:hypothetical protein LY78DRAFT_664634 [Colletotrichum sublineola]
MESIGSSARSAMRTEASPEGYRSDIAGTVAQYQHLCGRSTVGNQALRSDDGPKGVIRPLEIMVEAYHQMKERR